MPSTWSQVLLHCVFTTKNRAPTISPELQQRLYDYIGGIVRGMGGSVWAIGGMPDHVHLLIRWKTDPSIATLVREVKGRSSKWVHQEMGDGSFDWQRGYGVFSVSKSTSDSVKRYIGSQEEHHRTMDTREELMSLLKLHGIEFDERYLD